jgi:hypothetical protein
MATLRSVESADASWLAGRLVTRLALVMLALSLAGCSFLFSKGPADEFRPGDQVDCSGYALPVLDTMLATLNGIGAIEAATSDDASWKRQMGYDRSVAMALGGLWFVVYSASAIHGYRIGAACADAQEDAAGFEERRRYRLSRPMPYVPPRSPAPPPGVPPAPALRTTD